MMHLIEYVKSKYPKKFGTSDPIQWLYLMLNKDTGLFKIGISNDIKSRIQALQSASGCTIALVSAVQPECGIDPSAKFYEKVIHDYYRNKRHYGEWFKFTKTNVEDIRTLFHGEIGGWDGWDIAWGYTEVPEGISTLNDIFHDLHNGKDKQANTKATKIIEVHHATSR